MAIVIMLAAILKLCLRIQVQVQVQVQVIVGGNLYVRRSMIVGDP